MSSLLFIRAYWQLIHFDLYLGRGNFARCMRKFDTIRSQPRHPRFTVDQSVR